MVAILTPFLTAFILAYIFQPLTNRITFFKVPRSLAVLLTMLFVIFLGIGLILLLLNLVQNELPLIKTQFPEWVRGTESWLAPKLASFDIELDWAKLRDQITVQITSQISDNANTLVSSSLSTILSSSSSAISFFGNLVLILFVLFYLLLEWDAFISLISNLIPHQYRPTLFPLFEEVDGLLSQYLRGQLLVMLMLSMFYSIGLSLIGVKSGIALGFFTGLVAFIPYLGFLLSFVLSVMATFLQFGPNNHLVMVLILYGLGQFLEGFFLTPRLVGERIGLHPVVVLFALMAFGQLFGFVGILLAFPMSAITLVAVRFLKSRYLSSQWFKGPQP